jgi:hypothetical protein
MNNSSNTLAIVYTIGASITFFGLAGYEGRKYSEAFRNGEKFTNNKTGEEIKFKTEKDAIRAGMENNIVGKLFASLTFPSFFLVEGIAELIEHMK